jgi:hypothetical protein
MYKYEGFLLAQTLQTVNRRQNMKQHDTILMYGLSGVSVISSFLFIMYGMSIILSEVAAQAGIVFAYVITAYGLANIAILSVAWSSRESWAEGANKFIALCFLGVFVMDMMNAGMKSRFGIVGILFVALIMLANWFAVKKVISRA